MENKPEKLCACNDVQEDCICWALATNINCMIHGLFNAFAMDFLRGRGCPRCDRGVLEKLNINNYLTDITFQYPGDPHKFDFYLLEYNLLIQLEGDGYYDSLVEHSGCLSGYITDPNKERRKDEYCIYNKMTLLRLWNTSFSKSVHVLAAALMYVKTIPWIPPVILLVIVTTMVKKDMSY
jgi:hypothetical protein